MAGHSIHGHAVGGISTPTYISWRSMRARCLQPEHKKYKFYGGRGITICHRWRIEIRGIGFRNFLSDMGERPLGCTLDRINPNGNYELSNCRWATKTEQAKNSRRNKHITLNGETLNQTQWSVRMFGDRGLVSRRLYKGWTMEEAILTPRRQA